MKIIICLDNRNGMSFNNKRLSRDRKIIEDIVKNCSDKILMNHYSQSLFLKYLDKIKVNDNYLNEKGIYYFIETDNLKDYENKVEEIIIYKWNRDYPADLYFTINLSNFNLIDVKQFPGYSHEKITKEIYKRKG